jgi:hypothetical protein
MNQTKDRHWADSTKETSMCDYSLRAIESRSARVGDELITARFANTLTRGFCAVGEPNVAVCLLSGTELAFKEDAELDFPLVWLMSRLGFGQLHDKVARFRQINRRHRNTHHDALEFANGKIVLLTRLRPGQRAVILQMPASKDAPRVVSSVEHDHYARVR